MNKNSLKYYLGLILIFIIDALHVLYFSNNDMYDVYLYYNHERYLTNILCDISNLFKFSLLTYWLISVNRKIFTPLFITSLFIWISYFFFYNQKSSLFIIPIYLITYFIYNRKTFNV